MYSHAPSFQDAVRLYGKYVPDLGAVKASIRIHGTGMVLTGSDFTMQLGTKNSLLFTLQGSIEKMFITDAFHKGIELTGTLTGKSTSQLSELLGNSETPDIGPLSGKLLITGDSNNLVIPQISLFAGRKNHLMLTAAGKIAEVPLRRRLSPRGVEIVLTVTARLAVMICQWCWVAEYLILDLY
ncbi:hypothetical protein BMR04_15435 [Methylococcaceae bacterium HT3]|nr:hypothetical protein BMR04_15435 [Methylococcaceae bacterium HT3]